MCGIAGYWNLRSGRPADAGVLAPMVSSLIHRGPDDEGSWIEGTVALGMRRLAVVDLAGGHQPMLSDDGSVVVVFNGEIYNHPDLRRELEGHGARFRTRSDTEVIVRGFEHWGPACFERFNGMFAIALWDGRGRRLLLARDRLGIKPLYVWDGPDGIVFGSELKAVVACPWVPFEVDLEALDDFMTYEYVPAPASIARGVEKLQPAHYLEFRADRGRGDHRFWDLPARDGADRELKDPTEAARALRDRLRVSVRRRLLSDVPLGAFLSGGIDSSAIAALMTGELDGTSSQRVRTFSLGFADRSYDERGYASLVARHLGTFHREREVTPNVVELAERVSDHLDEPFADVSAFPTLMLSALAREEVTVALSGDGGDELFAGYDHYRAHRWAHRLRWLARTRSWTLVDRLLDRLPPSSSKKGPANLAKRFVEGLRRPEDLEHARWWVFWDLNERRALYDPSLQNALGPRDCFAAYRRLLREGDERGYTGLQRQLYADVRGYLADDILVKVDRMSMAVSLEARVPFLDHEFVEFAMTVPAAWKLHGQTTKWLLKRSMRGMVPDAILGRGKQGFSMPMKNWLRGPLQPLLHDVLGGVRGRGWFDGEEMDRLVHEHLTGSANHAHRLWCLMSLELSLRSLEKRARGHRPATAAPASRPSPPAA